MIYIFDKTQSIIKVLTNDDFTAAHLNFKINTATTFEFSLPASKALPSGSKYVATPHPLNDSKFIMLRLTERVDNTETIDYSAYELAYQELATDGYIEDKRPQNQSALNLMKIALDGSNWELNNVNVSGTATTNFYYVDHLSAISNVVDLLGGEIVFYIEIQGNAISGRYMDYLARQGADTSKVFASGSNLLTVERQSDTSNIYTAILPRGKGEEIDNGGADTPDGYGRRINIADVEWKKSSGKPLDKPKGSIVLSDPDATAEWGQINGNARLLLQTYDDIDDVNVLISSAYKTLQSVNHPQIQYSATVADVGGLSLGDTVLIMHGDRDLSYKTRVFEVKYDLLAPDQTELSLGDDLSSNSITSQINSLNAVADTTSSQTQWTINQIGRPSTTFGNTEPANPKVGDVFFKGLPDGGTEIYRWNGDIWDLLASPTTADDIAAAVTDAVTQAQSMDAELNQSINDDINATMTTVNTSLAVLDSEAAVFKSEADSATSSVASSVSALMTTTTASLAAQGSNAVSTANQALANASSVAVSAATANSTAISNATKALSQASSTATSVAAAASIANSNATKAVTSAGTAITNANTALSSASSALSTANTSSLATSSVASDVNGLKANYTSLSSSAGVLSSQTASLAVSASSASAQFDKVSSATGSLSAETAALKVSASSASAEFTKVNSSATSLAADTSSLKVSASSAALSIGNVQSSAGSLASETATLKASASSASAQFDKVNSSAGSLARQTASLAVSASSFATAVTSMSTENGSQATALSSLVQRADGFDLTVSKVDNLSVGGRNYVRYSSGLNGSSTARPTLIGASSGSNATVTYPSDGILMTNGATNTTTEWYYQIASAWANFSATPLVPGKPYTISADAMGTVPQAVLRYGFNGGTGGKESFKAFNINNTSWTRVSINVTPTPTNIGLYFRIQGGINDQYVNGWTGGETLKFRYVKIEDGNTPTAWSPAPEDVDAVTGSLAADTSSLKISASSAALDISHVASSAGSLAADTASLKVSASSAALSISRTQSTASSTATQATSLAVSASSAAVAISNVQSSAGSLSAETSSLKLSVSSAALSIGHVQSSAGSLATETAALKVSASSASAQFDKVNSSAGSLATQAASLAVSASSAAIGISNVTSSAGSLAAQTASLAVSASSFSTSITSMASQNGSQATAISALTQRADGFDLTVSKVDGITAGIGGRNWLLNTASPRTFAGSNAVNYTNTNSYFNLPTGVTTGSLYNSWGLNSKFVVSFDWSITGATIGGTFIPQFNGAPWGFGGTNTTVSSTNNKGHIVVYGTVTSAWSGTTTSRLSLREDNLQGSLTISNMKMEQGTVPTAWSPAPEDIDAQFATQKITIDGITDIVSNPTTGLSTRVQTAEGFLNTVKGIDIPALQKATFWQPYSSLNFNDYTKQGSFFFNTTSAKTNGPTTSTSWTYLMVEQGTSDTSRIKQTAWYDGVNGVKITYVRTLNSGAWSSWYANDNDSVATISVMNGQIKQEVSDRSTGDSNTLTQAKSFTTSQIATYDTGIQSRFTQTSDSFIATLSAINQVVDSSLTNGLDMWQTVDNANHVQTTQRFYVSTSVPYQGVASIGYNQTTLSGDYTSISTQMMTKNGWQTSTINVSVDVQARSIGTTDTDYFIVYLSQWDDTNTRLTFNNISGTISTTNGNWVNYRKKLTLNTNTTKVMLTYQMRGNGNLYISRPYVGVNELPAGAYVEGPVTNSTSVLALMSDKYTFGLNSNGQLISGMMGDEKQVTLSGKAINLDGNTTVSGDFYALGGNFKNLNASEIKTGTINASLINVININANNITTGKLNALLLTGNTGYLGTVNTGRVVNSQDNHLQLASYGFYDTTNDRAQVELLNNDSAISAEMRGSFNYYGNPTDKGHGLGIRMKYNQILAIDEDGGSKNLYLSPYAGGQVRIVSRDLNTYYDIAAANFKVSSQRKFKENITSFPDGALDIVNNTTIRQYTKNGVDEIGVITDEAPKELISSTGEFVSIYDYVSILYKAVQELSTQVNELNRRPNNAT